MIIIFEIVVVVIAGLVLYKLGMKVLDFIKSSKQEKINAYISAGKALASNDITQINVCLAIYRNVLPKETIAILEEAKTNLFIENSQNYK